MSQQQPSQQPSGQQGASESIAPPKKLSTVGSTASLLSARNGALSTAGSAATAKESQPLVSPFASFLNSSPFPLEDLYSVANALKPPEKNNVPSGAGQKGGSGPFAKYQKRITVKIKGRTFMELPPYTYVSDDVENESIISTSNNAKRNSASPKPGTKKVSRPSSSASNSKKNTTINASIVSTTPEVEEESSTQKQWEHRFVYFIASNHGGTTGFVEMHQTLIENQDFFIEREHTIFVEALQDLVYFESCPFVTFLVRREFDPSMPPSSDPDKKKIINPTGKNAPNTKKDQTTPPPGLPTTAVTKKVSTSIGNASPITIEELLEAMTQDVKAAFGNNCEIIHSFTTSTLQMMTNDKFGVSKVKYHQRASPKYRNWNTLLNTSTSSVAIVNTARLDAPSSSRLNHVDFINPEEESEFLNHVSIRIETTDGNSILSDEAQNRLNPLMVSISSLKDLPNETYLPEKCKPVTVYYHIRGKTFKTKSFEHDSCIQMNYQKIIYLGPSSEMEMYRDYFIRVPITFEVHDRDPRDGPVARCFGKADVALKTMLLNSRGREISESVQIQGVSLLQDEYDRAIKKQEEEKKKQQAIEEEKKQKQNSKSPKKQANDSPKVTIPPAEDVPITDSVVTEGKYVEKKSSIKLQLRFNSPFPQLKENEKSIYPVVITFGWDASVVVTKVEQFFTKFISRPVPQRVKEIFSESRSASPSVRSSLSENDNSEATPQPLSKTANKDILKYFCGFEICDGKKRAMALEITSKDALLFVVNNLEDFCNSEEIPMRIIYDVGCFYSQRLYEQLVAAHPKSEERTEKKQGGRRHSISEDKKPITRLRLQDTFENILSSKEIYIKNKKSDDLKILTGLTKLYSVFSVDTVSQIIENGILPEAPLLMSIKERYCDDSLIEIDSMIAANQKTQLLEKEQFQKTMRDKAHEERYNSPTTVEDLDLHLSEEIGFEGIPLPEPPPHLPPADKVIFEGEEKRTKIRMKTLKNNPSMSTYTLEDVSQPEKKMWLYIPSLKGHVIAAFPPMTKEVPPFNVHSYMTGTLIRSDRKRPHPKVRAFTAFGISNHKARKAEVTLSPDTIYCLLVSSWTQRASVQVDNKLDAEMLKTFRRASISSRNDKAENETTIRELSRQSSRSKHDEEMEKSKKKFISVPTYPESRKNLDKHLEFRNTAPPSNKPRWENRGKTTSVEDNLHPKRNDWSKIAEMNIIDAFDRNMEAYYKEVAAINQEEASREQTTSTVEEKVKLPKLFNK